MLGVVASNTRQLEPLQASFGRIAVRSAYHAALYRGFPRLRPIPRMPRLQLRAGARAAPLDALSQ